MAVRRDHRRGAPKEETMADVLDWVRTDTAPLCADAALSRKFLWLLWGDRVRVLETSGGATKVRARGKSGWVPTSSLGGRALLEVYFIDVGQGDGVLVATPDGRHVLIDGGWRRASQPTGKNAADFVDWKFHDDYGSDRIDLDAIVATHNDADHYGGLLDLLDPDPAARAELDCTEVRVEALYHAGLSWWRQGSSGRSLGATGDVDGVTCWTQLLGDRASAVQATAGAGPELQGSWAQFVRAALAARRADASATEIARLDDETRFLPGFEPAPDRASIRVLAPVRRGTAAAPALRRLTGGNSINTNGHSVMLRLDYGRSRILLTGDLNAASQRALLDEYAGRRQELECDVAKACHHGSEDVSYEFLQTMRPAVTVISSGDSEGHDHPRPAIVAASATTGHLSVVDDRIVSPLVYSTELARSLALGKLVGMEVPADENATTAATDLPAGRFRRTRLRLQETSAGDLTPTTRVRPAGGRLVVTGLVYGLVNVRTDGDRIVCATRNEADATWNVHEVRSRF
ncbi:MAG: hypothetical protein IT460_12105 [Planctomycetes bacterium]|nr:hypothetical protein [Planctomycetota bacterium]